MSPYVATGPQWVLKWREILPMLNINSYYGISKIICFTGSFDLITSDQESSSELSCQLKSVPGWVSIELQAMTFKCDRYWLSKLHVIMSAMASQITSLTIVYLCVYSSADQRKHQSSASLAFVRGIHRWPVNSPHKWPVTRKMFPFDDVIMNISYTTKDCFLSNAEACQSIVLIIDFQIRN